MPIPPKPIFLRNRQSLRAFKVCLFASQVVSKEVLPKENQSGLNVGFAVDFFHIARDLHRVLADAHSWNGSSPPQRHRYTPMQRFIIHFASEPCESCCPACGTLDSSKKGPRLFPVDGDEPICRDCGKRLAPNLVALLDLAHVADKVGRLGRHMLTPSMESLLDLARAAENYSHSSPKVRVSA